MGYFNMRTTKFDWILIGLFDLSKMTIFIYYYNYKYFLRHQQFCLLQLQKNNCKS